MSLTNIIRDFQPEYHESFLNKAEALRPALIKTKVRPEAVVRKIWQQDHRPEMEKETWAGFSDPMGKKDRIILDFGNHQVGRISFGLVPVGSPPDAPALLKLKFAEIPMELLLDSKDYHGEISSSWIQEEILHVDLLPATISLPRRYAFRYLEITVLDTSPKYKVILENVECISVSSADLTKVEPLHLADPELQKLDQISIKTMQDCMQEVFEDGPKRDRRLWIGDLRLQALVNYETFHNYDLVRRCLYLFAGARLNGGQVGACLFTEPRIQVDDTALFDYSLFFINCLADYVENTDDLETLNELFRVAQRQLELAMERLDERGIVKDEDSWWCFLDWCADLNKQAGAQFVLIDSLRRFKSLCQKMKDERLEEESGKWIEKLCESARKELWDEKRGFFVSGKQRQISWHSQIWAVLAGVLEENESRALLQRLIDQDPSFRPSTPYMMHHLVEALLKAGMKQEALEQMKAYWGEMVRDGADTFYEIYDPGNKTYSPYGSMIIHSYCHAWSGTPAYLIRRYFQNY